MSRHKAVAVPSTSVHWLMATLTIIAIPHFIYQPIWVACIFTLMMGWRGMHSLQNWWLPAEKRLLKILHSVGAMLTIGLVFYSHGMTIGRDAGVALLTTMLAFKVVEIQTLRDYYVSCFMGFFLVITHFFYTQNIPIAVLMLINVMLLIACLISVNDTHSSVKNRLKQAGAMVLQAMPLMLLLFILFPRVSGPIWGLPADAVNVPDNLPDHMTLETVPPPSRAVTGTADQITIGNISQLVQSDAIAFRVEFDKGQLPEHQNLYWRGPVLWHTDGHSWLPLNIGQQQDEGIRLQVTGPAITYRMTLEPHARRWLFALDFPSAFPTTLPTQLRADGELNSLQTVKQRLQYQLGSHTQYQLNPGSDPYLKYGLDLPNNKHERSVTLAKQLRQHSSSQTEFIQSVLNFYRQNDFSYSLSPPVLEGDSIDQFLFESRQGFCEHFAASFTVLMRAGGFPARIVTGYQGGTLNPVDNILTVRQRDAHAWTEVWLADQGWVRIDPTAAVSSVRVDYGIEEFLPQARLSPPVIAEIAQLEAAWQSLKNNLGAINNVWDMWVVGYDSGIQQHLLEKLGMKQPDWQSMLGWLLIGVALLILIIVYSAFRQKNQSPDRLQQYYQHFCSHLARLGIERHPAEGPLDYALRAQQALPEHQAEIADISQLYLKLRYRGDSPVDHFIVLVKQFRPHR